VEFVGQDHVSLPAFAVSSKAKVETKEKYWYILRRAKGKSNWRISLFGGVLVFFLEVIGKHEPEQPTHSRQPLVNTHHIALPIQRNRYHLHGPQQRWLGSAAGFSGSLIDSNRNLFVASSSVAQY
jgi:hypothetical protein